MTTPSPRPVLALWFAIAFAAAPAAAVSPVVEQNAAGLCQGTLPQFAGTLRARPLAIANDGAGDAFVTCALPGLVGTRYDQVVAIFVNRGSAVATISCTFVSGRVLGAAPVYYTRQLTQNPGGHSGIFHVPAANDPSNAISFNCVLPSRVELAYVGQRQQ